MKRIYSLLLVTIAMPIAAPALGQTVTLEDLARRVEALERDNAALRRDNQALRAQVERVSAPAPAAEPGHPPLHTRAVDAAPPAHVPAPAHHDAQAPWDYAYVGIQGGYTRLRTDNSSFISLPGGPRRTSDGPSFGAQLGRRWQAGNIIAGLELEAQFPLGTENTYPLSTGSATTDLAAVGRVKGQLGAASGPFAAYGIAGFQLSRFIISSRPQSTPRARSADDVTSFLLGAGLGYSLGNGLMLELEGMHTSTGRFFAQPSGGTKSESIVLRLNQKLGR